VSSRGGGLGTCCGAASGRGEDHVLRARLVEEDHVQSRNAMRRRGECEPTSRRLAMPIAVRASAYLDLQEIITANALVVHLVVSIVSITARLIFDKGEATIVWASAFHARRGFRSTYRRLEAERGAGMSQRTRRP
jgi:hypothetical protein